MCCLWVLRINPRHRSTGTSDGHIGHRFDGLRTFSKRAGQRAAETRASVPSGRAARVGGSAIWGTFSQPPSFGRWSRHAASGSAPATQTSRQRGSTPAQLPQI